MSRILSLIFVVSLAACADDLERQSERQVLAAASIFGVADIRGIEARQEVIEESPIPFIGDKLSGKDAWLVTLNDFPVTLGKEGQIVNPFITGFEALLDPEGSKLIEVRSIGQGLDELRPELPNRRESEAAMMATPLRYVGLPEDPPKLTIDALLKMAWDQGFARIDQAKEIRINYVLCADELSSATAEPRWVINLRGIPPMPGRGFAANLPEEYRSHLRLFYDEDGRLIEADNLLR